MLLGLMVLLSAAARFGLCELEPARPEKVAEKIRT
jgi:hypothetical protein